MKKLISLFFMLLIGQSVCFAQPTSIDINQAKSLMRQANLFLENTGLINMKSPPKEVFKFMLQQMANKHGIGEQIPESELNQAAAMAQRAFRAVRSNDVTSLQRIYLEARSKYEILKQKYRLKK